MASKMIRNAPSKATAFNTLPIELNKEIADYLTTHKDIANFSLICKSTDDAINADNYSFWAGKFGEIFARVPDTKDKKTKNKDLRRKYKERSMYLRRGIYLNFVRGHTGPEIMVVRILTDLIVESFRGTVSLGEHDRPMCPNLVQLKKFVHKSKILLGGKRPPLAKPDEPDYVNPALAAVRLMCAHFLFDGDSSAKSWFAIDESQKAVYAATNAAPLYLGPKKDKVNMEWLLHCLNFFRYYTTTWDTSSLYDAMQDLDMAQKPSAWRGPLQSSSYPLDKCWKGTYSYLEQPTLSRLRAQGSSKKQKHGGDVFITDLNVDEGKIQSLHLDFVKDGDLKWPPVFEDRLHSLRKTKTTQTRAQHSKKSKTDASDEASKNIQITGWGEDLEDHFFATGWLNPLDDQHGIPGWQRVTFMKHFEDDLDVVDQDNLWAYEGVVLPGGRIILGRWWYASDEDVDFDNDYSGPFILWAVDEEPELTDEEEDE